MRFCGEDTMTSQYKDFSPFCKTLTIKISCIKPGKSNERKSVLKINYSKSCSKSVKLKSEGTNLKAREITCMPPEVLVGLRLGLKFWQHENKAVAVYKTSRKCIN